MINGIKPFITIAEHVPEDHNVTGRPHKGPMHAAWHVSLSQHFQSIVTHVQHGGAHPDDLDKLLERVNPATNGFEHGWCTINFVVSHDDHQIMHQLGEQAKLFDEPAFERASLGAILLLTAPGIPMIWMGQEFGAAWEKSLDPQPLDWTLHKWKNNQRMHELYTKLIELRLKNPAFSTDHFEPILVDHEKKVVAYKRWNEEGNVAVIALNINDDGPAEVTIENAGLDDGIWRDELHVAAGAVPVAGADAVDLECKDHKITLTLPERGAVILLRQDEASAT
jgi:1,4-alpha-glucan branching enzyme